MLTRRGFIQTVAATPLGVAAVQSILQSTPKARNVPAVGSIVKNPHRLGADNLTNLHIEAEIEDVTQIGDTWTRMAPTGRQFFTAETTGYTVLTPGEHVMVSAMGIGFTGKIMRVDTYVSLRNIHSVISGEIVERS